MSNFYIDKYANDITWNGKFINIK